MNITKAKEVKDLADTFNKCSKEAHLAHVLQSVERIIISAASEGQYSISLAFVKNKVDEHDCLELRDVTEALVKNGYTIEDISSHGNGRVIWGMTSE